MYAVFVGCAVIEMPSNLRNEAVNVQSDVILSVRFPADLVHESKMYPESAFAVTVVALSVSTFSETSGTVPLTIPAASGETVPPSVVMNLTV